MRTLVIQEMEHGVLIQTTELDGIIESEGMKHYTLQRQIMARVEAWLDEESPSGHHHRHVGGLSDEF